MSEKYRRLQSSLDQLERMFREKSTVDAESTGPSPERVDEDSLEDDVEKLDSELDDSL